MGDRSNHPRKQSFRIPDRTEIAPESAHCHDSYIGEMRNISSIAGSSVNRIISPNTWLTTIKRQGTFLFYYLFPDREVYFNAKRNFCSSNGGATALPRLTDSRSDSSPHRR
jgi:hypothetical protein